MTKTRNSFVASLLALAISLPSALAMPQESADAAVRRVYEGLEEGRLEQVWQALPSSYQSDIRNILRNLAPETETEIELWNQSMGVMAKLLRLVRAKSDFILGHPMLAAQVADQGKRDEVQGILMGVADLVEIIIGSAFSDPDNLASLDVDGYLREVGPRLYKIFRDLQAKSSTKQPEGKTVVTLISSQGDSAKLSILEPGRPAREDDYLRVEGKWLPQEMVEGWDAQMKQVQSTLQMAALQAQDEEMIAQQRMMMGMLDQSLDQMAAADSQEEFNTAAQTLVGAVMMAAAAQAQGQ